MLKTNIKTGYLTFSLILCSSLINASSSSFKTSFPNLAEIEIYGYPFGQIYEILQLPELDKNITFRKLELNEFLDLALATLTLENVIEDEKGHDPKYDASVKSELEKFIEQHSEEIPEIFNKLQKTKRQGLQSTQAKQINQLQRSKTLIQIDHVNQMQRSTTLIQADEANQNQKSKTTIQENMEFPCIGKFNLAQISKSFEEAWTNSLNTRDKEMLITFLIGLINDKINLKCKIDFENILRELRIISEKYNQRYLFSDYIQQRLKETIATLEKITSTEMSIVY